MKHRQRAPGLLKLDTERQLRRPETRPHMRGGSGAGGPPPRAKPSVLASFHGPVKVKLEMKRAWPALSYDTDRRNHPRRTKRRVVVSTFATKNAPQPCSRCTMLGSPSAYDRRSGWVTLSAAWASLAAAGLITRRSRQLDGARLTFTRTSSAGSQ